MENNRINVGIVGLGRLGRIHANNLRNKIPNINLIAACSVVDSELDYAKSELACEKVFKDYDEMVNDEEIDAVVLVSPSSLHCNQITKALEAGKHVFCEKPLGDNIEEMEDVKAAVAAHPNQVFMLGFMRRFDPSYQYAKEIVDRGEIGEITLMRCYGIDPHEGMASFVEFAKNSKSGGLFLDMAVHDIDLIRWFTGKEFKSVWALGNNIAYPELDELGDTETGAALCRLEENKIGILVSGRNSAHGYQVETEIIGTKGSLRISNLQEKNLVTVLNDKGIIRPTSQNFPERFREAFVNELEAFSEYILNGTPSSITVEDGIQGTKVALACGLSLENNEIVSVN